VVAGDVLPSGLDQPSPAGLVLGGDVPLGIGAGMEVGRSTRLMDGS